MTDFHPALGRCLGTLFQNMASNLVALQHSLLRGLNTNNSAMPQGPDGCLTLQSPETSLGVPGNPALLILCLSPRTCSFDT
mmetsp:Transcript_108558/g.187689  ORF Transcript_108558/g.187689 Transcript_108558/m.187689 type:complete len:81 (+) Transcript_108558:762-1004(+)